MHKITENTSKLAQKKYHIMPIVVSLALSLCLGFLAFITLEDHNRTLCPLFACLSVYSMVAAILRLGWLVPCTIIGVTIGVFLDPLIKRGTIESQMGQTVTRICYGTLVGLVVGFIIDINSSSHSIDKQNSKNETEADQHANESDGVSLNAK